MTTLAQIMSDGMRRNIEWANGRIVSYPGNWVFEPTKAQIEHEIELKGSVIERSDADGRTMYIVKQSGVHCNNGKWQDVYPHNSRHGDCWFVPQSVCRKCEHYRKGKTDGLKYPHCAWARELRGGTKGGRERTLDQWASAVKEVKEIIG